MIGLRVFLQRINSLMMIITLCLMVYNVGQYEVREALEEQHKTLKNQVGKATAPSHFLVVISADGRCL